MADVPIIAVEINTTTDTFYFSTHAYYSRVGDMPSATGFEPRLVDDITFDREVGCVVFGTASRGEQSYGVIRISNADGGADASIATVLRNDIVIIKRGLQSAAYSTFTVSATLIVDRVDTTDELVYSIIVTDTTAVLEVSVQTSLYSETVSNQSVRRKPRPITFGRCYQVPYIQPDAYGNGRYDLHDTENWIGVEQVLDAGATLTERNGYRRAITNGVYGIERLTAVQGKQCATVLGAFQRLSLEITEDFASLASWTETNGGIGGRDVSIVSNAARILNTAGGADLSIAWNASTPTGTDAKYWFYEFECTIWVSGYALLRTETTANQCPINGVGRYTGIIRASGNVVPSFVAPNGSNCDLTIDSFRLRVVAPLESLQEAIFYLASNDAAIGGHGPLPLFRIDDPTIDEITAAGDYKLAFHLQEPTQIADMLDMVMASFTGWWFINRLGLLSFGQLLDPAGSPVLAFDENNISPGMRVELDQAKGLSNRALGKKNWQPYAESELVDSLQYVALNALDKDADVAISAAGFKYTNTAQGSVRSTPIMAGERYYIEVTINTVGTNLHLVGVASDLFSITQFPGGAASSIAYLSNAARYIDGVSAAFGATYIAGDVIGIAVDGRSRQYGSRSRGDRVWFSKNGVWQGAGDPSAGTAFISSSLNSGALAFGVFGAGATGNSGTVNFGQSTFAYTPPNDFLAPAWHRGYLMAAYRDAYQSAIAFDAAYTFADASEAPAVTITAGDDQTYLAGIPSLLSRRADLVAECDRRCALYTVPRYIYTFDAFIDGIDADELVPGDLISVTYGKNGLASKLLRVLGVRGSLLNRRVTIKAWG